MKYEILLDKPYTRHNRTVYRIRALRDIVRYTLDGNIPIVIEKGEVGGLIEHPHNLSQEGSSWIYAGGVAIDNAEVLEDSIVFQGLISKNATMVGKASVMGPAAIVTDNADLSGLIRIDNAKIRDNATIKGQGFINGALTTVYGNVDVDGKPFIQHSCKDEVRSVFYRWDNSRLITIPEGITQTDNFITVGRICYHIDVWREVLKKGIFRWSGDLSRPLYFDRVVDTMSVDEARVRKDLGEMVERYDESMRL